MRRINRLFPLWALLSLVVPTVLGFVLHGFTAEGALRGLVWGGLVRAFFLHHITWSINSVCHYFGRRRFAVEDHSTNVAWLALPSFGEAWHHNHHAFPRSASHGLRRREIDISGLVIGGMERVGLAWNVVRISPERQAAKAARPPRSSRPSRSDYQVPAAATLLAARRQLAHDGGRERADRPWRSARAGLGLGPGARGAGDDGRGGGGRG